MSKTDDNGAVQPAPINDKIDVMVRAIGTRTKAAAMLGITVQQLRRLIAGTSRPSMGTLLKLTELSGYGLDWVMAGRVPEATRIGLQRADEWSGLVTRIYEALRAAYVERWGEPGSVQPLHDAAGSLLAIVNAARGGETDEEIAVLCKGVATSLFDLSGKPPKARRSRR